MSPNERAGAALRAWRRQQKLSLEDLAAKLATVVDGRTPGGSLIAKWERGVVGPGDSYFTALAQLGAPVDGWRNQARIEAEQPPIPTAQIDAAEVEVQRMLAEGAPLGEVYAVASRALSFTLRGGLSPDRQRAWQMLVRLLRDGAAERGRVPPLEEHPDWPGVVELMLDVLGRHPGATQELLEALRRGVPASERRPRKAAA